MSLGARLTLFFVIIVVLPVTAVTAYGRHAVARSTQRQVRSDLEQARGSATVAFTARAERAHEAVAALARDPTLLQAMAAQDAAQGAGGAGPPGRGRPPPGRDRARRPGAGPGRPHQPGFLPGVRRAPLGMLLAPGPRDVRSWPMLQRRSADLRQRGCTPSGSSRW